MREDIKQRWINALRSGDYEQGGMQLRDVDNRFCCLGVLCDLAIKEGVIPEWNVCGGSSGYMTEQQYFTPPGKVYDWAELNCIYEVDLVSKNDQGVSFSEIADYIEEKI